MDVRAQKEYLENVLKIREEEKQENYLRVMGNYGTQWWKSDDPAEIVMFQLNEPVLLVPFIKLQNALESVLSPAEVAKLGDISYNNIELKQKAVAAIAAMA